MKIYISQPMKGFTDDEIKAERERIKKMFGDNDYINQLYFDQEYFNKIEDSNRKAVAALGISINMMNDADLVICPKGTWRFNGCTIEKAVAETYDIPMAFIEMYPGYDVGDDGYVYSRPGEV